MPLKIAVKVEPQMTVAHFTLGKVFAALGSHRQAIEEYKKTLAITPIFPDGYFQLGRSYISLKKNNDGVQAYNDTLRLSPNFFEASIGIGKAYINAGRNDEAIAPLRNAIAINPGSKDAYDKLGLAYANICMQELGLAYVLAYLRSRCMAFLHGACMVLHRKILYLHVFAWCLHGSCMHIQAPCKYEKPPLGAARRGGGGRVNLALTPALRSRSTPRASSWPCRTENALPREVGRFETIC